MSFTLTGTAGTNGWFKSNVTIHWSVSEPRECDLELVAAIGGACQRRRDDVRTAARSRSTAGTTSATATVKIDKTAPSVSAATPARGPDSNGWYNHAVAITATGTDPVSGIASCSTPSYSGPDNAAVAVDATCTDNAGNTSAPVTATLKYDATAPAVTAAPSRAPDANGWYNHAVAITAAGTDPVSGVASCSTPSYSGPDNPAAAVDATCTDNAGNTSAPVTATLKYDATAPTVAAAVDRPPDAHDWYRSPLKVSFTGTDSISGIASCTAPAEYKGPDRSAVTLSGTCGDAAGNAGTAALDFKYDATGPKLSNLTATSKKGLVQIGWQRSADAVSVELVRRPGRKGSRSTTVYRGTGRSFADKSVRNGLKYRYELRLTDEAGNVTTKALAATPRPPLYKPALGTVVHSPLRLAWDANGARFYNVQLLHDGVKVLSAWPRAATFLVHSTWRYAGKTYQLGPGHYRWYVWGARGSREQPKYGRPLGTSTFLVK